MSLDFYLVENNEEVFRLNITHNLTGMADAAWLYKVLWRPDENKYDKASQCIKPLLQGLNELVNYPEYYKQFESSNGWGTYQGFLKFVMAVIAACIEYPNADVKVSR